MNSTLSQKKITYFGTERVLMNVWKKKIEIIDILVFINLNEKNLSKKKKVISTFDILLVIVIFQN
jgi:hypothetical protein